MTFETNDNCSIRLKISNNGSTIRLKMKTRLHQFARSLLYNATAWWLRKSHIVNCANHQHSPGGGTTFAKRRHDVSNYIPPLSFGKSFMKIRSAVPENGCIIFLTDGKKQKTKYKKNICKTYTHLPPTGRRLRKKHYWHSTSVCTCIVSVSLSQAGGVRWSTTASRSQRRQGLLSSLV